jgi:hypothetical protein
MKLDKNSLRNQKIEIRKYNVNKYNGNDVKITIK